MDEYIDLVNKENRLDLLYTIVNKLITSTLYIFINKIDKNEEVIYNYIAMENRFYLPIFTSFQHLVKSTGKESLYLEVEYNHIEPLLKKQYHGIILNPDTNYSLAIESTFILSIHSSDKVIRDFKLIQDKNDKTHRFQILVKYIGRNFASIKEILYSTVVINKNQYTNVFIVLLDKEEFTNPYTRHSIRNSFQKIIFDKYCTTHNQILLFDTKPSTLSSQNPIVANILKNILPSYIK